MIPSTPLNPKPIPPRPIRGMPSPNSENAGGEPDPDPVRPVPPILNPPPLRPVPPVLNPPKPRPTTAVVRLADHPRAEQIMANTQQKMNGWDINVALLGQRKYMVNDCLGLKVSAGEFSMRFGNSQFAFAGNGVELTFAIDRISFEALTLRMRPNPGNPAHFCNFGSRFQVGGSASDIRVTLRYDPRIDLDECRIASLGTVSSDVRLGGLNLKPLQNDLDAVAKDMIVEAIQTTLDIMTPNILGNAITSVPDGLCVSKVWFYNKYMEMLALDVAMYPLPDVYLNILQPYYPHADLRSVRFGYGNRQPPHNGTTDCDRIYFNGPEFVDKVRNAAYNLFADDVTWLYHELRHVEQCAELGGRTAYADRWFRDIEYSVLLNLIHPTAGASIPNIHDWMPMEQDADARAQQVYDALTP